MQRRLIVITGVAGVAMLLVAVLMVGMLFSPGRQVATWETALQAYLDYKVNVDGVSLTVVETERATSPQDFDKSMGGVTYGDDAFYDTRITYRPAMPTPSVPGLAPSQPKRPIPYPPKDVWCVLLAPDPMDEAGDRLVFSALHQDLYNAAWIVHEVPSDTFMETELRALGCNTIADAARP